MSENPEIQTGGNDLNLKLILLVALVIITSILLIAVGTRYAIGYAKKQYIYQYSEQESFATERLYEDEKKNLNEYRKSQIEILNSYEWVDRDAGIVKIPIARAIEIYLERSKKLEPSGRRDGIH